MLISKKFTELTVLRLLVFFFKIDIIISKPVIQSKLEGNTCSGYKNVCERVTMRKWRVFKAVRLPLKMIPQKLNFPMNFFETFPECSLPSTVSKNTIKMIGHHSRLRDAMGQSCPIYACTRASFIGPRYILR